MTLAFSCNASYQVKLNVTSENITETIEINQDVFDEAELTQLSTLPEYKSDGLKITQAFEKTLRAWGGDVNEPFTFFTDFLMCRQIFK